MLATCICVKLTAVVFLHKNVSVYIVVPSVLRHSNTGVYVAVEFL